MNPIELIVRLVVIAAIGYGGYVLYRYVWQEPVTRTGSERAAVRLESGESGAGLKQPSEGNIDDCQRYINADHIQSCLEARAAKQSQ